MSIKLFDLTGKNALVTGSTRGIGLTLATGLAEAGARILVNGTNREMIDQRVREFGARGLACAPAPFDVTKESEVAAAVERIEREIGPIDILVNNAGIQRRAPLEDVTEEDWQAVLDLNLTAVWRVGKYVARRMIPRRAGKIINIASLMSWGGRPTTGPYTAAKGGLVQLTKAMTVEWAQHNIQINSLGPGYFITEMTKHLAADPEFDAWVKLRTPAKRWGQPEELVGLAIFLASAASDFVTGQLIFADGGWTANI